MAIGSHVHVTMFRYLLVGMVLWVLLWVGVAVQMNSQYDYIRFMMGREDPEVVLDALVVPPPRLLCLEDGPIRDTCLKYGDQCKC